MKQCTKCKEEKELTEFHKCNQNSDGMQTRCKACRSLIAKQNRENDPEKYRLIAQLYKTNNPEKVRASKRKWAENNREKILAKNRKYHKNNREKMLAKNRKYRKNNREKILVYERKYREKNREKIRAGERKYNENNREKVRASRRKYKNERRKRDPNYALTCVLRARLSGALRGQAKAASTMALLGCTVGELRQHLEKQFTEGMSWTNRGTAWHVDHILPCSSFDLSDAEQQRRCFHWSNLQPLFAFDNLSKGDKLMYDRKWTEVGWVDKQV